MLSVSLPFPEIPWPPDNFFPFSSRTSEDERPRLCPRERATPPCSACSTQCCPVPSAVDRGRLNEYRHCRFQRKTQVRKLRQLRRHQKKYHRHSSSRDRLPSRPNRGSPGGKSKRSFLARRTDSRLQSHIPLERHSWTKRCAGSHKTYAYGHPTCETCPCSPSLAKAHHRHQQHHFAICILAWCQVVDLRPRRFLFLCQRLHEWHLRWQVPELSDIGKPISQPSQTAQSCSKF